MDAVERKCAWCFHPMGSAQVGELCILCEASPMGQLRKLRTAHEELQRTSSINIAGLHERAERLERAIAELAHHVGVGDGDDARDPAIEALAAVKLKYDEVVEERNRLQALCAELDVAEPWG